MHAKKGSKLGHDPEELDGENVYEGDMKKGYDRKWRMDLEELDSYKAESAASAGQTSGGVLEYDPERTVFVSRGGITEKIVNPYQPRRLPQMMGEDGKPITIAPFIGLKPSMIVPKGTKKWRVLGKPAIKTPRYRPPKDAAEFFGLREIKAKHRKTMNWDKAYTKWSRWCRKHKEIAAELPMAPKKEAVMGFFVRREKRRMLIEIEQRNKKKREAAPGAELKTRKPRMGDFFKRKGHTKLMLNETKEINREAVVRWNVRRGDDMGTL
eukprot:GDKI01034496.1.p1 GENE.GDKI01034496.1~~GDKI01034496.1.p1  ORF type:complete len:267 (-),score=68.37 GDKI01034496.1:202-1002(-)